MDKRSDYENLRRDFDRIAGGKHSFNARDVEDVFRSGRQGSMPIGVVGFISLKIPLKMDSKARLSAFLTACSAPLLVV